MYHFYLDHRIRHGLKDSYPGKQEKRDSSQGPVYFIQHVEIPKQTYLTCRVIARTAWQDEAIPKNYPQNQLAVILNSRKLLPFMQPTLLDKTRCHPPSFVYITIT